MRSSPVFTIGGCTGVTLTTSTPLRAARKRRIARLRAIIAELKVRDIGSAGIATLLDCSQSAARQYLAELRDAGVICARTFRQADGDADKFAHRLHSDPLSIERFLARLDNPMESVGAACTRADEASTSVLVRRIHLIRDDDRPLHKLSNSVPQPDPLISALFGRSPGR